MSNTTLSGGLFEPFRFDSGVTLRNRVVMAPMTTWSANPDGSVSEAELEHYRRRAQGVGLVITGCTHVLENGIGFTDEFAAHDDRFIPSLRRLAESAKSGGALAILQIFHAGNKAVVDAIPNGEPVSASGVSALPGPFNPKRVTSRALSHEEVLDVIHAFGQAARRAIEAGFDGVELHGAHGFLIQNFFSPRYNLRTDDWGGSLEERMRLPLAIVREVQAQIAVHARKPFLLGYRFSPEEREDGGYRLADVCRLLDALIEAGVDYLHASLNDILGAVPLGEDPRLTAEQLVAHVSGRVPLMGAGQLRTPAAAQAALALGLPLVAVGKGLIINPDWVALSQAQRHDDISETLCETHAPRLVIPDGLWRAIKAAPGWFPIRQTPAASEGLPFQGVSAAS
jgi:2,4-dienoyl-CoA reductase (NADPH2)